MLSQWPSRYEAKKEALTEMILAGMPLSVVSMKLHIPMKLVEVHDAMLKRQMPEPSTIAGDDACDERPIASRDDPWRTFRRKLFDAAETWRHVDAERRTPERLQMILQEAFADEEMGL